MTININLRSSQFISSSLLAKFALALACIGCSSMPRVEKQGGDTTRGAPIDIGTAGRDVPVGGVEDPSPQSDENLCSTADLGVDDDGYQRVQEERYNFARMNYKLDKYPALRTATGLTRVSGCDDARAFIAGYNRYRNDHPEFVEEFPASPHPPIVLPRSDEDVAKIYGGSFLPGSSYDLNTMGFQSATRQHDIAKGYACSAVRLAPTVLLTAAHCVPTPNSTKNTVVDYQIWIRRATATTEDFFRVPAGKIRFYTKSQQSPNYTGTGDFSNDLALIYIPYRHPYSSDYSQHDLMQQTNQEISAFASPTVAVGTRTPATGDTQIFHSWGPTTGATADPGIPTWKQNIKEGQPIEDAIPGDTFWSITASDSTVQMCSGDSGSPAYRNMLLDGIAVLVANSKFQPLFDGCAANGTKQYWTNVNQRGIRNWYDKFLWDLQDDPTFENYFVCGFVPGYSGTGTYDPENPDAYYYCGYHIEGL